jgi:putative nucleotidyltransferase with HDIG domain
LTDSRNNDSDNLFSYIKGNTFQRAFIGLLAIIFSFLIVQNGAAPKKYKLNAGDSSPYDIEAPRDIINTYRAEQRANTAAAYVTPVMKDTKGALDTISGFNNFITYVEESRKSVLKNLADAGIKKDDKDYQAKLETEQRLAVAVLNEKATSLNIPLSQEQLIYIVSKVADDELTKFRRSLSEIINNTVKNEITLDTLPGAILKAQNELQLSGELNQDLKNIGAIALKSLLKPTKEFDPQATNEKKARTYDEAYDEACKVEKIPKGNSIVKIGDIVTEDKIQMLDDLNLLEKTGRYDFVFASGILFIILLSAILLYIYMRSYCQKVLYDRVNLLMLTMIIILALLTARIVTNYLTSLAIPFFAFIMLIAILFDVKLACVVNVLLVLVMSFITKGNTEFIYLSLFIGPLCIFFVSKANNRSRLSLYGLLIGLINSIFIIGINIIYKSDYNTMLREGLLVLINGIISMTLTIGMLPFWESIFNAITPFKLLELSNPNQPLLKLLLMEAPGTYHHSLMVGNLAEAATDAINGNSLLARVGAYFHDIGKLKRPFFFVENQLDENPHNRMTPNLSALVITSHTKDGLEIAAKYKLPQPIKDIIAQHHGTTLLAYFYNKAKNGDKGDSVSQDNFRYSGPKPKTREAAVVMLADSVEAAVRAMPDKTSGRIEGFIHKIIREKLDDGQLDKCDLTLGELNKIGEAFNKVLSGYFHARIEYPKEEKDLDAAGAPNIVEQTGEA